MNHTPSLSHLKEDILNKIKAGQAKMRPKPYFVVRTVLAFVGVIIAAAIVVYLVSFIYFVLHRSGAWYVPAFGVRGVGLFLKAVPWVLIAAIILFVALLEILVRRYSFTYRKPLVYSVAGISVVALAAGYAVAHTSLHRGFYRHVREGKMPFAAPMYQGFGMQRFERMYPGKITTFTDEGFVLHTPRDEALSIIVSPQTRFPLGTGLEENDTVVVMGERDQVGNVHAFGIRPVDEDFDIEKSFPRRHGGGMMRPRFSPTP